MKAAQMKTRPHFALMKQTDVQSIYYMQMPRWLCFDPRYADLSLDAKVTYTFLLNCFQLSRRKGWINEQGEVFIIFPRQALANELRICEKRVTAAFRALAERELVWEKRCGRGDANQIYLARVEPRDDPSYECAPFSSEEYEGYGSRTADLAVAEPRNPPSSKKDTREKDWIQKEVSPSVRVPRARTDGPDDEKELMDILDACELSYFPPETARVFENAIEQLYYSDSLHIGSATLPRNRVRRRLRCLDGMILRDAAGKLAANLEHDVKNSTAYTMVTIFNAISESESDLMVDPYLNSLAVLPERR